ncbi:Purine catabolism protein PucB [Thalassocella blandensis]|nr:Purine catabolism protein PucB [Thalassocella blandensis]
MVANHDPGFLVLAAGKAQRFGGNKLTEAITDKSSETVIETTLNRIAATGCKNICVVVSESNDLLRAALTAFHSQVPELQILTFPQQSPGLGDSICQGVKATAAQAWTGWIICLADMPLISTHTYTSLLHLSESQPLVAPHYEGLRGHPVYFSERYAQQLCSLQGDSGAKSVLQQHADQLFQLDVEDPHILLDIDTPSDLTRARHLYKT